MDNLTEALGLFTRASRLAPNDPEIERGLAHAAQQLETALSLDPRRDDVRAKRLTVSDEASNGLYFLTSSIWKTVPRLARDVAMAFD